MNWYVIGLFVIVVTLTSITFGQENSVNINGTDIDVSSGGNSVKIENGKVTIRAEDGGPVKTHGQKAVTKSSSGVSTQNESRTFSEDTTISHRNINTDGDGLILKGNGDYLLTHCNINAGKNAIIVSDNATVSIKNCVFNGKKSAILMKDNATVEASKNVFSGKIKKLDNAEYIDSGGNVNNDL
ncbi:MAG: hypothetical protein PVI90_01960 [Desulfobacteraceae bacterium]|jgi:hypothetical protein